MRYREKGTGRVFEANLWEKSGDHPKDDCGDFIHPDTGEPFKGEGKVVRYYRNPGVDGKNVCLLCGRTMHDHGWIDQVAPIGQSFSFAVCPGNFVLEQLGAGTYFKITAARLKEAYEPAV